ncbi:hypothetical protein H0H81_004152, partial [Sphagnurus paluster]
VVSVSPKIVDYAIDNAQRAFESGVWSRAPAIYRSKVLSKLARILEERVPELAKIETLQTGRTIREMNAQLGRLPEWISDYFAALLRIQQGLVTPTQDNCKKIYPFSTSVAMSYLGLQPFNHPLLIAVKKIAPALAAGNSIIMKPSELAPISVLEFSEMAEAAGVPPDVLTVLPGLGPTIGKAIVSHVHIRKIDITAPILVFEDTDVSCAVNGIAFASFVASGQTCVSGTRILVQDAIYDEFLSALEVKVKSITSRMGDPMNPYSTMGPIISMHHLERIEYMVSETTGSIVCGGQRMSGLSPLDGFDYSKGAFYAPTIVENISSSDVLWQEEVFGPVIVIRRFKGYGLQMFREPIEWLQRSGLACVG